MKQRLLTLFLLGNLLLVGICPQVRAQSRAKAEKTSGYIPWFTVQNEALVVQTGDKIKPLAKDITLPNGIRVEYRTRTILLTNGTRVPMKEGDMLSLNGEFVQKQKVAKSEVAATPAPARTAPVPVAAPTAPMPIPAAPAPTNPAPIAAASSKLAPAPVAEAFNYKPTAPVNGKLKGVVELGASGFNSFVISIDEKRNWKLERSEYGNSLVMENLATEDDIRKGLKAYIGQMLDYGVSGRDIHFVVSSGAMMAPVTTRIIKALASLRYVVNTVTPEQEGIFSLKSVLPPSYNEKAFVVDIGSGNTKISWLERGVPKSLHSYGAKFFEKNIDPAIVTTDVNTNARQVPAARRGTCFIIGGVPFDLAKQSRQGKERYTALRSPSGYADQNGAKVKAGLTIYEAVVNTTNCPQFIFDWDANFTIGYLLSLP